MISLSLVLVVLLAFLIGTLLGWYLHSQRAAREIAAAKTEAHTQFQELITAQFHNLATEILEQKKEQLSQQSTTQLGHVLSPLKENLEHFRKRVEEIHTVQVESSGSLRQQLSQLSQLNHQLSTDAQNLASALQGKSQRRGAWGELILERTLELSGLERGREFELQVSTAERLRPDAIIHLPEDRIIVIDSKVSLVDYERACNAAEESERQRALSAHAAAVRTHIKSLAEKGYPDLFPGKTPEMTMMFLPIEPAFGAALTADPQLFEFAFAHRIILVTPSTLLAALRTINNFWKVEKQTKNVLEIARLGGVLHDRFVDFTNYLLTARSQIAKALTTQDEAIARLSSQKGNLISTAQRLQQLGAKTEKKMSKELLENFLEEENSQG
ncbi:MAG: DNA recombination protein RmuC [Chthoniobacterales bacterium]|nr:DNA recombination protein RmuC [Chthoniobacterales bacterium]